MFIFSGVDVVRKVDQCHGQTAEQQHQPAQVRKAELKTALYVNLFHVRTFQNSNSKGFRNEVREGLEGCSPVPSYSNSNSDRTRCQKVGVRATLTVAGMPPAKSCHSCED